MESLTSSTDLSVKMLPELGKAQAFRVQILLCKKVIGSWA